MQGAIDGVGEEKLELLKVRMQECGLFVLALSEVRLPDQGVTTYNDGFVLIAAGFGSQGELHCCCHQLLRVHGVLQVASLAGIPAVGWCLARCSLPARKGCGPLRWSTVQPFALRRLTFLASGPLWLAVSMIHWDHMHSG